MFSLSLEIRKGYFYYFTVFGFNGGKDTMSCLKIFKAFSIEFLENISKKSNFLLEMSIKHCRYTLMIIKNYITRFHLIYLTFTYHANPLWVCL